VRNHTKRNSESDSKIKKSWKHRGLSP
jgi:hypothetical protein